MVRTVTLALIALALLTPALADSQFATVTPEWVAAHSGDANVRVLDTRGDFAAYLKGHVPNAVNLADSSLRGPYEGIPVQYLSTDLQAEILRRAGVRDGQTVVVYADGEGVLGATMVAYVLERLGHSDVRLMDGGWAAYQAAERLTQAYPQYKPGDFRVRENRRISVDLGFVRRAIGDSKVKFIDARPESIYAGNTPIWMRNGHIPGAINIDWHSLVTADNQHKIRPLSELEAIYTARGIGKDDEIVVYCGTGREATLEFSVMRHLLGFKNVRLYDGSWTEYCSHSDLPVETGVPR